VNCETFEEMMSALVDGALGPMDSSLLFSHMGGCAGCQEYLRYLLRLRNAAAEEQITGSSAAAAPRRPDRPPRALARARIQVSVPSAALALIMVVLWTLAITVTVFSGSDAGPRQREQQAPAGAVPWQAEQYGQFTGR